LLLLWARAGAKPPPAAPPRPSADALFFTLPATTTKNSSTMADVRKFVIEAPTEKLLAARTAPAAAAPPAFVNPKVEPGKVRWHKDFAAATRAAQTSGKPVLLFQMMGKLDDRFC
jgi:hypothetical protein